MTTDQAITYLALRGYRAYPDRLSGAVWSASRRLPEGSPECETNGAKIAWHVRLYETELGNARYQAAEVEIVAENTADVWYKLQAYALPLDTLKKKMLAIEQDLLAAWVALC